MKQQVFTLILFRLTSGQIICHKKASTNDKVSVIFVLHSSNKLQLAAYVQTLLHDDVCQRAPVLAIHLAIVQNNSLVGRLSQK